MTARVGPLIPFHPLTTPRRSRFDTSAHGMDAAPPQSAPAKPRALKLCIIGDSGVGKTSLRSNFLDDAFTLGYRATIGADFKTKLVVLGRSTSREESRSVELTTYGPDGVSVLLSIWDTAGASACTP